jgi:hypothetical protein
MIVEADSELSKAAEILSTHEHRPHLIPILATRAGVRAMQNRLDEAEGDCAAVLEIDPGSTLALRNKGLTALVRGRARQSSFLLGFGPGVTAMRCNLRCLRHCCRPSDTRRPSR